MREPAHVCLRCRGVWGGCAWGGWCVEHLAERRQGAVGRAFCRPHGHTPAGSAGMTGRGRERMTQIRLGLLSGITIFAIGILLAVDERLLLLNYGERHTCEGVVLSFFSKTGNGEGPGARLQRPDLLFGEAGQPGDGLCRELLLQHLPGDFFNAFLHALLESLLESLFLGISDLVAYVPFGGHAEFVFDFLVGSKFRNIRRFKQ